MVVSYISNSGHSNKDQLRLICSQLIIFKAVVLSLDIIYFYCWIVDLKIWRIVLISVVTTSHLTVLITWA